MRWIRLIAFEFLAQFASGQDEDKYYMFNKDWKPSEINTAAYFIRVRKLADTNYEWLYYKMYGPRIKKESYKDLDAKIKHGKFIYYSPEGIIDSLGQYAENELNGSWYFVYKGEKPFMQKDYEHGRLIKTIPYEPKESEAKNNSKPIPGEKESEYPGGVKAWLNYITKNLHYPDRAFKSEAAGTVVLQFMVGPDGSIIDSEIRESVELSLDEESLRLIKASIKWVPATKDGVQVKSYKLQPITFSLK
jgi:TonB family protein